MFRNLGLRSGVWEFGVSVLGSTQQNNIRDADETKSTFRD